MAYALLSNPNKNFYTTRQKKVRLIGLHVTAGLQDLGMTGLDNSAENTNKYGATTNRAASWHKIVDSDGIEDALPDEYTAFHIRNYNSISVGLEIANLDARWDNKPKAWVEATLRNAAKVCHAWEKKFDIPRRLLTKAQVDAGHAGYSYHMFLDPSRRRDPGETFPWGQFVGYLAELDGGPKPKPGVDAPDFPLPKNHYYGVESDDPTCHSGYWEKDRDDIKRLEKRLLARGWKGVATPNGTYGNKTRDVVKAFQKEKGLTADGFVGPKTWKAIWESPVT